MLSRRTEQSVKTVKSILSKTFTKVWQKFYLGLFKISLTKLSLFLLPLFLNPHPEQNFLPREEETQNGGGKLESKIGGTSAQNWGKLRPISIPSVGKLFTPTGLPV